MSLRKHVSLSYILLLAISLWLAGVALPSRVYALPLAEEETAAEEVVVPNPADDPEAYAQWKQSQSPAPAANDDEMSSQASGYITNGYINGYINNNGQFNLGTSDNKYLLYNYPGGTTSETLIRIDGEEYWFHDYATTSIVGDTSATSIAKIDGLEIKQEISFETNTGAGDKELRSAHITYSCRKDPFDLEAPQTFPNTKKKVAIRIMLDTMLGQNDGAPFKIMGNGQGADQQITYETEFTGNSIPTAYQAMESLDGTGLCATGYLKYGKVKPAKVQFAYWGGIRGSSWDYQISNGNSITGDSAVAIYFADVEFDMNALTAVKDFVTIGETKYGSYSVGTSNQAETFNYDLNTYQADLALDCARYAALAYGDYRFDSTYGSKGLFYKQDGGNTKDYFKQYAAGDGFKDIDDKNILSLSKQKELGNENTSTFFLAHKPVVRNGQTRELVLVAIRGTYGLEWAGNFSVTGSSHDPNEFYHRSFKKAADDTRAALESYIQKHGLSNVLVMVCGHSRGGATGNILARQLTDGQLSGVDSSGVFAYLFATPYTDMYASSSYGNIYNFCFKDDFVPNMPFNFWGNVEETDVLCIMRYFGKNGTTYTATADTQPTSSNFYKAEVESSKKSEGRNPSFSLAETNKVIDYIKNYKKTVKVGGVKETITWYTLNGYYAQVHNGEFKSLYNFMHDLVAPAAMPGASLWDDQVPFAKYQLAWGTPFDNVARYFVNGFEMRKSVNDTHQMYTYYNALVNGVFGVDTMTSQSSAEEELLTAMDDGDATLDEEFDNGLAELDETERAAVDAIVAANAEALQNAGWDLEDPETWSGFEAVDGHMVAVRLSGMGLTGTLDLSAFTVLQTVAVDYNQLTALILPPADGSQLTWLTCSGNNLTSLDVAGHPLQMLDCSMNYLDPATIAPVAEGVEVASYQEQKVPEGATYSVSDANWLAAHVLTNPAVWDLGADPSTWFGVTWELVDGEYRVTGLELDNMGLAGTLDVSGLPHLARLTCANNDLSALNAAGCASLTYLNCTNNQLASLDVSGLSLSSLFCSDNLLPLSVIRQLVAETLETGHQQVLADASAFAADEVAVLANIAAALEEDADNPGSWEFVDWAQGEDGLYHAVGINAQSEAVAGELDLSGFGSLATVKLSGVQITGLVLPDAMTTIGDFAFYDCDQLTSVKLPAGLTTIGEGAFANCSALTMLVLPSGVTEIGRKAFANCQALESVYATGDAPTTGEYAFAGTPAGFALYYFADTQGWEDSAYADCLVVLSDRLSVSKLPDKMRYELDETFDPTGLELILISTTGTYETVTEGYELDNLTMDTGGAHTITVRYGGEQTTFDVTVAVRRMEDCSITFVDGDRVEYTGGPTEPQVVVYDEDGEALSADEYTVSYENNEGFGQASVTVTGNGRYVGSLTRSFYIIGHMVVDDWAALESEHDYGNYYDCTWEYTATGAEGSVLRVTFDDDTSFESGYDYLTVLDANDEEVGRYTSSELAGQSVLVPGLTVKLCLTSDASVTQWGFKVSNLEVTTPIASCDISVGELTYNGREQTPTVTVKQGLKTLVEGEDYTITGVATNAGRHSVAVEGIGAYSGVTNQTYQVKPASLTGATIARIADQAYIGGEAVKPKLGVTVGDLVLKVGSDYQTSFANNTAAGTATVTITGVRNFEGTARATFRIVAREGSFFLDAKLGDTANHGNEVCWMGYTGISEGWKVSGGREFRGLKNVTRCDFAAFLYRLADLSDDGERNDSIRLADAEVAEVLAGVSDCSEDTDHAAEVAWMIDAGISKGWTNKDGSVSFRPMANVARQDMAAFLYRYADIQDDGAQNQSLDLGSETIAFKDVRHGDTGNHADEVEWLASVGVTKGWDMKDGTYEFRGTWNVARQDMAAFMYRLDSYLS